MPPADRYGRDVLSDATRGHRAPSVSRRQPAETGLVVEDVETGWCGAIVRVEKSGGLHVVVLEDRRGRTRTFPLGPGFWLDGEPVRLVPADGAAPVPPPRPARTASGSVAVAGARARVARASRILVEGRHDAELVEKVWGDDLRLEGVVVQMLDGVDHLAEAVMEFGPAPGRRLGVLVDHLVTGSKETRLVATACAAAGRTAARHVLVVGHPFVDIWQAVRPAGLGLPRWPDIPRGTDIKTGTLAAMGWPHDSQADVALGWRRILGSVRSYADLEPALLAKMEELVDFVTGDHADR